MKRKILFALLMGIITTGIISFTIISLSTDLKGYPFLKLWLRSWSIAYVVVIPCILILSPIVEKLVGKIIRQ